LLATYTVSYGASNLDEKVSLAVESKPGDLASMQTEKPPVQPLEIEAPMEFE